MVEAAVNLGIYGARKKSDAPEEITATQNLNSFFDTVDKVADMNVEINPDLLTIMLLHSLPTDFENFRRAIESRDDLPTAEAFRIKIVEESDARKSNACAVPPDAMIAKQNIGRRDRKDRSEMVKSDNWNKH